MNALPLLLPLSIPLGAAIAQIFLLGCGGAQRIVAVGATAAMMASGIALILAVKSQGPIVLDAGNWTAPVGIRLQADMLAALMVAVTGLIGFCGAIHGIAEVPVSDERRGYHPLYQFLLFGVCGSFLTNDIFNLFVWFEVMLLSSFVLLALGGGKAQIEGAVKYMLLNIVASLIFLIGAGVLYGSLGTLNMADVALRISEGKGSATGIRLSAVLLLLAFAIKAGAFPLYSWLPSSYHTPRHTVSAVFAGLLTKVGVCAIFRLCGQVFVSEKDFLLPLLGGVALLTMVMGVLGAASQYHTRKILAFHSISQIGYMMLGLSLGSAGALAAAILFLLHHSLVKTTLFFAASVIDRIGGGERLENTGGLYRTAPWLAALFMLAAISLAGLPPFSGFWVKLALVGEALGVNAWWSAALALAVGMLTLFSMTKIWAEAFWKDRPASAAPVRPVGAGHAIPMVVLTVAALTFGLYPSLFFDLAETAARQLLTTPLP